MSMHRMLFFVIVLATCGAPERGARLRAERLRADWSRMVIAVDDPQTEERREARRQSKPSREAGETSTRDVITISALGDCALGDLRHGAGAPGSFSAEIAVQSDPMAYPFSGVKHILAADDLTIANLEGVLTPRTIPKTTGFAIRGEPGYAAMFARGGVQLVDLANNHSEDYGAIGLADTRRALADHGVAHFGLGVIDARLIRGIKVVNLGYIGGRARTLTRMVREVGQQRREAGIVIVSLHWGLESIPVPDGDQRRLGRAAIRAGADLVLGHHPHVLQGIETYRERHIVYSLANFVFGANSRPADFDSMIYQERFHLSRGKLQRVEGRVLPVRISSTTRRNDFRPVLLEGHDRERLLAKLDRLNSSLSR
jgi:poly-gamma-glutamate synthesis protein (capsule biosynthesis protein)